MNGNPDKNICCGIVLYNPDISILEKNIYAIKEQVDKLFIVDNASNNLTTINNLIKKNKKIVFIKNKENKGIAYALNQLCKAAFHQDYKWILTLDQDSVCSPDFVNKLKVFSENVLDVGIVAPIIKDRNVGVVGHVFNEKYKEVKTCITSGALTNLKVWEKISGFDEKMFIDRVDFDYCYRIRKAGFKVIQTSTVTLDHSIGNAKIYRFLFWKFIDMEHTSFRAYYIAQNNIYYPRKNKLIFHLIRGNLRNLKYIFLVLLYENNKKEKLRAIIKGWKNGYKI